MVLNKINAALLKKMVLGAAKAIEAQKEYINELNVFPVPDGDTGTNMTLTIMAAAKEVNSISEPTMETVAKAMSGGSLRGARGNSGVILSQLFRGFSKEIKECTEIDTIIMAKAFEKAVETAYKAVMKPKEGTILTVARGAAERASELVTETDDLVVFGEEILKKMEEVLAKTPEMLPVLKEAGVVDSGGQGLLEVIRGAFEVMLGKEVDFSAEAVSTGASGVSGASKSKENISTADIKFGYCTEFIINLEKEFTQYTENQFKSYLESIGDSIVVVSDDEVVKVHVHTNDPGLAIQKALTYGSLSRMKIDNMREEHNERLELEAAKAAEAEKEKQPRKQTGFVAVSIGEGIDEIFKGLGVDYLISGGQTMNPSTEDMLNAIDAINADTIYILPNNKNIILAAEQAAGLTKDKKIVVIPSTSVPQGIGALINYMPDKTPEDNAAHMTEEMRKIKTGQVTYAVRDTSIDGKEIRQGNIMGLGDKTIISVGDNIDEVAYEMLAGLIDEDSELISIYYGEGMTEESANAIAERIMNEFDYVDVEVHLGGQPIYYYIVSVE